SSCSGSGAVSGVPHGLRPRSTSPHLWCAAPIAGCMCRASAPCLRVTSGIAAKPICSRARRPLNAEALSFGDKQGRRALRLYHLYRLIIGLALVLLISSELDGELLDLANATLFRNGSWLYLFLNILFAVLVQ